jgi:N-acetylglucosaminyldiphosphoundecaprenol N-acetyl-beta-D-mannosaminyltransferase
MSAVAAGASASRVDLLGYSVDPVDMGEAVARIDAAITEQRFYRHADLNGAIIVAMQQDDEMRESIARADLLVADGQSVVWAARLLGRRLPARVAGIDLMHRTIELAEQRGYSVYILGARQDVLERAVERLKDAHPALRIAGYRNGYFDESEEPGVTEAIRRSRADILFVAIGSPRKEYFLGRRGPSLGVPYVMGVGGSIDVVAGVTRRAPVWIQRIGLEWAFRLVQEPRRLFRRYLVTNARFLALVAREAVRRRPAELGAAAVEDVRERAQKDLQVEP